MSNDSFDIEYLRQYINGELPSSEMYAIERAAHEDEMLTDILLGLEFEKNNHLANTLDELKTCIAARTASKEIKKISPPWTKWSIAAAAILILGFSIYMFRSQNPAPTDATIAYQNTELAQPTEETTIEDPIPANRDSLPTITRVQDMVVAAAPLKKEKNSRLELPPTPIEITSPPRISADQSLAARKNKGNMAQAELEEVIILEKPLRPDSNLMAYSPSIKQLNITVGRASSNSIYTPTEAQNRARINQMNIDPHTKMILEQALINNKIEENKVLANNAKSKQNKSIIISNNSEQALAGNAQIAETDKTSTANEPIAPNKSSMTGSIGTYPNMGWNVFYTTLKTNLIKRNIPKLHAIIEISLNNAHTIASIKVLQSDVPNIEKELEKVLINKDTWTIIQDNKKIQLSINY